MNPQVAARAAARKGPSSGVNFQRQNQQQLQEQAAINRERRKQASAEEEKQAQLKQKLAAQYSGSVPRRQSGSHAAPQERKPAPGGKPAPGARGPPVAQGERIEVFIRETDPGAEGRAFAYFERDAEGLPSPAKDQPVRGYSSEPVRGPPGGMRGAARRTSGTAAVEPRAAPSPGANSRMAPSEAQSRTGPRPGQVPKYLLKRKQELADEKDELRQHAEDQALLAKYPPGMVPLDEDRRIEILKALAEKKEEVMLQINKLPMRFDTHAIRKRREALEEEIRDVESQVAKFSRKEVFVPFDQY